MPDSSLVTRHSSLPRCCALKIFALIFIREAVSCGRLTMFRSQSQKAKHSGSWANRAQENQSLVTRFSASFRSLQVASKAVEQCSTKSIFCIVLTNNCAESAVTAFQ